MDKSELWDFFQALEKEDISNDTSVVVKPNHHTCSSCFKTNILFDLKMGCYVCSFCGLTQHEILEHCPEWSYGGVRRSDKTPVVSHITFYVNTNGTNVKTHRKCWRQVPYRERSLNENLRNIEQKCDKYNIARSVIDNSKILYRKIQELTYNDGKNKGKNIIIRGKNRVQIISSCIYFGASLQKFPKTVKETAQIFDIFPNEVTKGCRKFLHYMKNTDIISNIRPLPSILFVEKYCLEINLSVDYIKLIKIIVKNIVKLDLCSHHQPISISAAAIVLVIQKFFPEEYSKKKKQISKSMSISEVTINKMLNKIQHYFYILAVTHHCQIIKQGIDIYFKYNSLKDTFFT
ncbi:putative transcription initiation factor IIB-like protein [Namao virus]|nr:putative transcription initiation factor IIB-like protein [Namao virus]